MSLLIALVMIALGVLFIWRVIALMSKHRPTAEPTAPSGDTGVREPNHPRRPNLAGAVALEEPDEDDRLTDAVSRTAV
jgi:hypothetical protein